MTGDSPHHPNDPLLSQNQYPSDVYGTHSVNGSGRGEALGDKLLDPLCPPAYTNTGSVRAPPQHQFDYTQHSPAVISDVVDLQLPLGLNCTVDKSDLLHAPISSYTADTFRSDNAMIRRWPDYVIAFCGPLGVAATVLIAWGWSKGGDRLGHFGHPMLIGIVLILVYCFVFIKPIFQQFFMATAEQLNDKNLSNTFTKATFQRQTSDLDSIRASIVKCQSDIPQILYTVVCSGVKVGAYNYLEDPATVQQNKIQFVAHYSLPIAHYRFVGTDQRQFLSAVDEIHRGDSTIEFKPELILHSQQEDYLQKFYSTVYETHKHRAKHTSVFARFVCGQFDSAGNWTLPDIHQETRARYEPNVGKKKDYLKEHFMGQWFLSTSLGQRTEFYQADGRSANSLLRFMTSSFMWVLSAMTCLIIFILPFLQCRWKQITYHSAFRIIFPDIDQIIHEYQLNTTKFAAHPPHILNSTGTAPADL